VSANSKGISVGCADNKVYVRVVGRGTFQNSQPLRRFALEMIEHGCEGFYVDLAGCHGMDSTFLGVLAGIGLRMRQDRSPGAVRIINAGAHNGELLRTMGLDRLFHVAGAGTEEQAGYAPPSDTDFQVLPDSNVDGSSKAPDKDRTTELMLEAHEDLIRADQRNAPKFRDVTKFLREKLREQQSQKKN
jgi:anti-sigma B factor antagonist